MYYVVRVDPDADAGDSSWKNKKTNNNKKIKTLLLGRAGGKKKTQNAPSGGKNGGSGETQKQNSFVGKTPWDQDCGRFRREQDNTGHRKKTD